MRSVCVFRILTASVATPLQELLVARYEGHWYPNEPHRGCAYRVIMSTVNQLDPLLLRAAESTGQRGVTESFIRVFSEAGEVTCWVRIRRPPPPPTQRKKPRPAATPARRRALPIAAYTTALYRPNALA